MPDRKQQDWTPDEAFWNEAWTDMNGRLARRKRRGLLPYLWWALPIVLAGSLVLSYQPFEPLSQSPASTVPGRPIESAESIKAEPSSPDATLAVKEPAPASQTAQQLPTATRPPQRVKGPSTAPALAAPVEQRDEIIYREAEKAVAGIGSLSPQPLDITFGIPLIELRPAAPEIACLPAQKFVLAAGGNTFAQGWKPGGFAEIGNRIGTGKWSIPLALQYRFSQRGFDIKESFYEDAVADMATNGSVQPPANFTSNSLRAAFAESGFNAIRTHELELRGGLGRSLGSCGRLYLSGGAAVSYLLVGKGPVLYSRADGTLATFSVAEERFGSAHMLSSANAAPRAGYTPVNTKINRFNTSVWLRADMMLGSRFGITMGVSRYLGHLYREGGIDVQRTRLELGLSRRL